MPGGSSYRGRFAPSPSGPLHLGSLIAALASYLDARHCGGSWLVRMDDLDPPREQAGAAEHILHSLQCHGLQWDEEVVWQSRRGDAYEAALAALAGNQQSFRCECGRRQLSAAGCCQGHCKSRQNQLATPWSIRVTVPRHAAVEFDDGIQGHREWQLGRELQDFIVKRKDSLYAYQLAVVVDDASQGISHIVRGSDLLDSTARQIFLQRALGLPTPHYAHHPVINNSQGQKFSKQHHAPALIDAEAAHNLRRALAFLAQADPPGELSDTAAILSFACEHWSTGRVPAVMAIPAATVLYPPLGLQ